MENNSDRMGFALIALSVVAFVLLAVNGPLKSTVGGFFNGFKDWQTATVNGINETTTQDIRHTAYSWSSDGTDRFTTTKPNLNLINNSVSLSSFRINNNNTSDASAYLNLINGADGKKEIKIDPSGIVNLGYYFRLFEGLSYTDLNSLSEGDTLTFSFDAKVSGLLLYGYESRGMETRVTSTISSDWKTYSETIHILSLSNFKSKDAIVLFDNKGTGLMLIRNVKLEKGSVATAWMPSASEVKPSDQPKYIGTYTDKNGSASQDLKKYTWKLNPEYHK